MLVELISLLTASVLGAGVANDNCAKATAIVGEGVFGFDNTTATTDGPPHSACARYETNSGGPDVARDLWYCWTATCDGVVTIDTCKQTTVDTRLAVYAGCNCPTDDSTLIACNDEPSTFDDDVCGVQSRVSLDVIPGQTFLIRLGSEPSVGGGAGTFTIACRGAPETPCTQPDSNCQSPGHWNALVSDGTTIVVADDFSPAEDDEISEICWHGVYANDAGDCPPPADAFEVTYYADDGGFPGAILGGPFRQADGTLALDGPMRTFERVMDMYREFEYRAAHAPVPVLAGGCYWVQIVNVLDGACLWHWEAVEATHGSIAVATRDIAGAAPKDLVLHDLAWCLNVPLASTATCRPVLSNDWCEGATPIAEGITFIDTSTATGTPAPNYGYYPPCDFWQHECCSLLDDEWIHRDIWFTYTPPCDGLLRVEMCDAAWDAKLSLLRSGDCPYNNMWLACGDDECGDPPAFSPSLEFQVTAGQTYHLQVGGYRLLDASFGTGSDCFAEHPPEAGGGCDDPICENAVCNAPDFGLPYCCNQEWDWRCAEYAFDLCTGVGGPGSIFLDFGAPPYQDETLKTYVDFLACFSGACSTDTCDPPIYPEPCCLAKDYDEDGDVDGDDYALFEIGLTGPKPQRW